MADRVRLAMRMLFFLLLTLPATPRIVQAGDAEGCADLKLFPRLEGCVIVECAAKQHDSFDAVEGSAAPLNFNPSDANTNSLAYSCPLGDLQKMRRDFDAQLRKAGYQTIAEDKSDAASLGLTARKNSQWIHWNANTEDGATTYSLTTASSAGEKFKAEACSQPASISLLKACEVVECTSKSEDSVSMRTTQQGETSLAGNVQTVALACPSNGAAGELSAVEGELKASGFEILFSDHEHPEGGWMTARSEKRWMELVGSPEGESVSYTLTVVPSAEVLTASPPEPKTEPPTTIADHQLSVAPKPAETAAQTVAPAVPVSPAPVTPAPESTPVPPPVPTATAPTAPATAPQSDAVFVPPTPILQVPIEATHDRIYSVVGDVVISLLVDVSEDGRVTKAELTGHITKDVLKLQRAALEAVSHWRFEPAHQDGRIVPAVKIAVEMHFRGRPWRY